MTDITLADFLRARLDEDQAAAEAASSDSEREWIGTFESGHPWRYAEFGNGVYEYNDGIASGAPVVAQTGDEAAQDHIARHDPARVLAQVAAMRAVLDAWPDAFGQWSAEQADAARAVKDMIRRKLAAIWSSHPDYDPAWAPEGE